MSKTVKSFVYNFLGFALFFLPVYFIAGAYTGLSGFWVPLTAFMVATLLAPKFQAVKTREGDRIFVKWLFFKGVREVK